MNPWERFAVPALISVACAQKPIMYQRRKVVPEASGDVLELGCGSGTNFAMYDRSKVRHLHALEPAPGMVARARKTSAKTGWAEGDDIDFLPVGAEAIPLGDNSVDTAVITFVLCTIPDWQAALAEVRRVLKPGGRVPFAEHGLSPDSGVAKWQRRIEPVWKPLAGGCHLTRNITALFEEAGYQLKGAGSEYMRKSPKPMGYVSWGAATPR